MMEFAIAKMSTKGQIVIPAQLRENMHSGDEFLIVKDEGRMILKNVREIAENLKDDIAFARKTDAAWKRIEEGKGVKMEFDDFIQEMKKW